MIPLKHITLMPNPYRDQGFRITQATAEILRGAGAEVKVCLPFHVDRLGEIPQGMRFVTMEEALRDCELLICFGGDGTILHAARMVGRRQIPLLGINTGTMGFMAELESDELELLSKVMDGSYTLDQRMLIHVAVKRNGRIIYEDEALNDAVITKGAVARVIQLTVSCDKQEAMRFDGDGVIIATPTGATAYSMSAGGPIVEPTAENIIVTSICAHAMFNRSLVLAKQRQVAVKIGRVGKRNAFLSVDGGKAFRLNGDDEVIITASNRKVNLVKVKDTSFYSIFNHKFQR